MPLAAHNGLFRIDPRVDGNKLVESQYKQYASKNDFSAAVTTEGGKIAVASNKGDIRLFDAVGKNAKVGQYSYPARPSLTSVLFLLLDRAAGLG